MALFFASYLLLCWYWRVLLKFRDCRIHFVPRLGVRNENVHLWLKPTRIIQAACQDSDKRRIASFKFASRNSRSAFRTKTPLVLPASDAGRKMVAQLPARKSKCFSRQQHAGNKSAPSRLLTIATMAFKHHDWLSGGFVTNRAARAPASERYFHVISSSLDIRQVVKTGMIIALWTFAFFLLCVGIGLDNSKDISGRICRISEPADIRNRHLRHTNFSAALLDLANRCIERPDRDRV